MFMPVCYGYISNGILLSTVWQSLAVEEGRIICGRTQHITIAQHLSILH